MGSRKWYQLWRQWINLHVISCSLVFRALLWSKLSIIASIQTLTHRFCTYYVDNTWITRIVYNLVNSSAWLCQQNPWKSKFVRRPSVASIISEPIVWISFKLCSWFLWAICPDVFWILGKIFMDFLRIFFVVVNMGPLKRYSTLKSLLNLFSNAFELSSQLSSQKYFWFMKFLIFNEFLKGTFVPYGET